MGARRIRGFNNALHNHTFGFGGHQLGTAGAVRGGLAAGLGVLAIKDAQNTYQKLKYGEIGGAMLSAAMTAGAAAGAYHMATNSQAMKQAINFTAIRLRGISKGLRSMR